MVYCDIDKANKFASCPGKPYKVVYSPHVMPNGEVELVESGKEDLQQFYNSYAESTDIHEILHRYQDGDVSALNARTPMYGDFTSMPTTLAEFMQLDIDARTLFETLPAEVRQEFDNDVGQFLAASGTDEWFQKCEPGFSDEMRQRIRKAREAQQVVPDQKESEVAE